jgi:predicted small metal-binding protein
MPVTSGRQCDNGAVTQKVVRCECGLEIRGTEDEIVPLVQQHGRELHNMEVTREQVLAMAVDAPDG